LDCAGAISWIWPKIYTTVTADFTIENIGESGSELNWEIESYPDCGEWTFDPDGGTGLTPEDGAVIVDVEMFYTGGEFLDGVRIINVDNPDDYCIIDISIGGSPPPPIKYIGFIRDLEITEYHVTFHAIFLYVNRFFFPRRFFIFNRDMTLPNLYEGDITEHFVWATFSFY